MFKKIEKDFKIEIIENKINNKFFKDNNARNEEIMSFLTIEKIANTINDRPDKIKIVKGVKYHGLIVYEHRIIIEKNFQIRIAYCIDFDNNIIYIIGICHLVSGLRKNVFDHMIKGVC